MGGVFFGVGNFLRRTRFRSLFFWKKEKTQKVSKMSFFQVFFQERGEIVSRKNLPCPQRAQILAPDQRRPYCLRLCCERKKGGDKEKERVRKSGRK